MSVLSFWVCGRKGKRKRLTVDGAMIGRSESRDRCLAMFILYEELTFDRVKRVRSGRYLQLEKKEMVRSDSNRSLVLPRGNDRVRTSDE